MSQEVLKQMIECEFGQKIELTVYENGTVVVTGARRVNVVNTVENMSYDIQKLAPNSSIAVIVECGQYSIEAEMIRYNAPWMGLNDIPKISAIFSPSLSGEVSLKCSEAPPPVPIAPPQKVAA